MIKSIWSDYFQLEHRRLVPRLQKVILDSWKICQWDENSILAVGTVRLCAANAAWNATGVTVAGQTNGTPSSSLGGLRFPSDLYVYGNGTLLIADYGNDRIVRWQSSSTSGTLAAGTGAYGSWGTLLARPTALTGEFCRAAKALNDAELSCK